MPSPYNANAPDDCSFLFIQQIPRHRLGIMITLLMPAFLINAIRSSYKDPIPICSHDSFTKFHSSPAEQPVRRPASLDQALVK